MEDKKNVAQNTIKTHLTILTNALASCMAVQANELIQPFDSSEAQE